MCFLNVKYMSDGKIYALCALPQLNAESTVHNGVLSELSDPCGAFFFKRTNQRLLRIGELLEFEPVFGMDIPFGTWTL